MKRPDSPLAVLGALALSVLLLGLGLTSPIWFLVAGRGPLEAMRAGLPIMIATMAGLVITAVFGLIVHRLQEPAEPAAAPAAPPSPGPWRDRLVHLLVLLMFGIPFLTIIIGYLLRRVIDADAG